jgi:hypothetical protein
MLRMLITFEIELTAYQLVLEKAQDNFIEAGIPWDMMSNVRKILKSPALPREPEAEYVPFAALPNNSGESRSCASVQEPSD